MNDKYEVIDDIEDEVLGNSTLIGSDRWANKLADLVIDKLIERRKSLSLLEGKDRFLKY